MTICLSESWGTARGLAVLVCISLCLPSPAIGQQSVVNPLLDAAVLLSKAREERRTCAAHAEEFAKQARDSARRVRGGDRRDRELVSIFLIDVDQELRQIRDQRRQIEARRKLIARELKDSKPLSALDLINAELGTACDRNYQRLRQEASGRIHDSIALAAQAERIMNTDPGQAERFYRDVLRMNAEFPRGHEKLAEARELRKERAARTRAAVGRAIGKTILWTVIVGAIGAGGYYAYREAQKQRNINPATRPAN